MERPACEGRPGELGLFSVGKGSFGVTALAFQGLQGAWRKDAARLFSTACSDRTSGNGFTLTVGLEYRLVPGN